MPGRKLGTTLYPEDFRPGAVESWGRVPEFNASSLLEQESTDYSPKAQVQPAACFHVGLKLRMAYTVFKKFW